MREFYNKKKVLITGHTGFKGSYLCEILLELGADVIGISLDPPTEPSLFGILRLHERMTDLRGDIRDLAMLQRVFDEYEPEIVFHLAAQPLVRVSYENPVLTYSTNVMGTVHICECIRTHSCVKSFLNVTTDKVYDNPESGEAFTEEMRLDGYDPYSNSKSCSELVTHSYCRSFLDKENVAVSTARAGNVIGGGDFAKDRIIPDCFRALSVGQPIVLRNPNSVRPYQHVLEPLYAYLLIAKEQYMNSTVCGSYNVGPNQSNCITTATMAQLFCDFWGGDASWYSQTDGGPHEAGLLMLNCDKLKKTFGWKPFWNANEAVEKTVRWYKAYVEGENMISFTDRQIGEVFHV